MHTPEADEALRWLASHDVTRLGPDRWLAEGTECPTNDVAHTWVDLALNEEDLPAADLLRRGFGLLDLLDEYWVTVEMRFRFQDETDPLVRAAFWAGYRERLEREDEPEQVLYSLWVDWFEDPSTCEEAFRAVLADDIRDLRSRDRLADLSTGPLHRRAARILENSGPIAWSLKHDSYQAAVTVPELQQAVFLGLLHSYHDFYGQLEPAAALDLMDQLRLPPDTEHLEQLRAVLSAGGHHHYRTPELWNAVLGDAQLPGSADTRRLSSDS